MTALKGNTGSLQPWYKRRASARTTSARSILLLLSFILITFSLAVFVAVNTTVLAADISLLNIKARYISYNGATPMLKLGTFGYCIDWAPDDPDTAASATQSPICFHGNGYNTTTVVVRFFNSPDVPIGYIARLTPAAMALHPFITALVSLVLVTAALPCFVPPIFAVTLSWLTTASSIAAVGCIFSLAMVIRSRVVGGGGEYVFEYGTGIWALLVGAISVWAFTALLTTAWWLRRRSDWRNSGESIRKSGSTRRFPDVDASVESQVREFPGESAMGGLPEGKNAHRHELFNTDMREQGRVETGMEERYELGTPERSMLQA
ncbi:hypothetical protein F5B21DRAFT_526459 [Xylaria acuta]|nr:hypothetical protein F5B21DRAFT_526459 [Xylaria acuta]